MAYESERSGRSRVAGWGILCAFALLVGSISAAGSQPSEIVRSVAVVVHRDNPIGDLSQDQLERIFKLRRRRWSTGEPIYLVMQDESNWTKHVVLERIYDMTSRELKRHWLSLIHRGEMTGFPRSFTSDESTLRFVGRAPNSIGFVDASRVDARVKAISIGGRRPGEDGYLLNVDGEGY